MFRIELPDIGGTGLLDVVCGIRFRGNNVFQNNPLRFGSRNLNGQKQNADETD
jgi:hypothetical protein